MRPGPEHRQIPENWNEKDKNRRRLINEFRDRLNEENYGLPLQTEGVVVLSAPHEIDDEGNVIEKTQENISRIKYSIDIIKQIASQKTGISLNELTPEDIINNAPPLILNGETEQLQTMEEIALEEGFPKEHIQLQNCGDRGIANTKIQFEVIDDEDKYQAKKHFTFITSSYHVPRVTRTADANLRVDKEFEVIGVPYENFDYNIYRKAKGEIKRILQYSEKGDITKFFKEPATPLVEFGDQINNIKIDQINESTPISPEATDMLFKLNNALENTDGPKPFNGELVNVEDFKIEGDKINLKTSKTDYFSYLASSYAHRENHAENPIKPLAVSASLLSPDGKLIVEERSGVTELEGKLGTFGGALRPGEKPEEAILDRLRKKLGIEVKPENLSISGADQENLQNIVEIFYLVKLEPGQLEQLKEKFTNPENSKKFVEFSVKEDLQEIESHFHDKDITDWNPSSFYNTLYALIKAKKSTPVEINALVDKLQKKINRKPFRYKYPIQNILESFQQNNEK